MKIWDTIFCNETNIKMFITSVTNNYVEVTDIRHTFNKIYNKKDITLFRKCWFWIWDKIRILKSSNVYNYNAWDIFEIIWVEFNWRHYTKDNLQLEFEWWKRGKSSEVELIENKKNNLKTNNNTMDLEKLIKEDWFNEEIVQKVKILWKTLLEKQKKIKNNIKKLSDKIEKENLEINEIKESFQELDNAFQERDTEKLEEIFKK